MKTLSAPSARLMAFEEKGIDDWKRHHVHLFKGEQFSPEYLKLNPKAVVPTLVHDGHVIRESAIIADYIDDLSDTNPLKPADPSDVMTMREWVKDSDDYHASLNERQTQRAKTEGLAGKEVGSRFTRYRPRSLPP